MPENFLANPASTPVLAMPVAVAEPQREPIKVLLIGSPKAVTSTIHSLYCLRFAEVGEWSPLLPTQNPGEVMSILVRRLLF
ncbi:peptide ABC transporter substrate-binding protein [Lusitaniella coriacea]|uniref:peptide ABC transporter substrate-binding protein n=1 Tax=Lusitaniella coriacea TaxID=1983105 RepID=UPI003CF0DC33